jgi:hypothetical protein
MWVFLDDTMTAMPTNRALASILFYPNPVRVDEYTVDEPHMTLKAEGDAYQFTMVLKIYWSAFFIKPLASSTSSARK